MQHTEGLISARAPAHVVPVGGFFEWKAIKGRAKPPYAIAMKDGSPFGLASIWDWVNNVRVAAPGRGAERGRPHSINVLAPLLGSGR